jgi:nucleoside phosphorylase
MQCILSALKSESEPLIEHYKLFRDYSFSFPFFRNNNLCLIGTGVGKKNIKKRITSFISKFKLETIQFINIGIAGGNRDTSKKGQIYLINQIIDNETGRSFYPDILIKHGIIEHSITTTQKVIVDNDYNYKSLVDMESSEIFDVCSKNIFIHNIALLKIVSDNLDLDSVKLTKDKVRSFISSNLDIIDRFLSQFKTLQNLNKPILSKKDSDWVISISSILSLTKTQYQQLLHFSKGYRVKSPESSYPIFDIVKPNSKHDRNQIFKSLCEELTS